MVFIRGEAEILDNIKCDKCAGQISSIAHLRPRKQTDSHQAELINIQCLRGQKKEIISQICEQQGPSDVICAFVERRK